MRTIELRTNSKQTNWKRGGDEDLAEMESNIKGKQHRVAEDNNDFEANMRLMVVDWQAR